MVNDMTTIFDEDKKEIEKNLLKKFWKISLPIFLIQCLISFIIKNPAPLIALSMVIFLYFHLANNDDELKLKLEIILKNKYVKIFVIICILPFLLSLIYKNVL